VNAISKAKTYKCAACKKSYEKRSPWQLACSVACAVSVATNDKPKVKLAIKQSAIADTKKRKIDLKTRSDWIKDAQKAFNGYIRARDINQPCISCGVPLKAESLGGGYDCGHYRSVGSAPHLRFDDQNAHGQCKKCNRYLAGNAIDYRRGLIGRIGQMAVDRLESDHGARKYTIDGLIEIINQYKKITKPRENT
jgi:ribosomal protein L37AE/L43A